MKYLGAGMCVTAGLIVGPDLWSLLAVMIAIVGGIIFVFGGKP